jgi:hypothetical protein
MLRLGRMVCPYPDATKVMRSFAAQQCCPLGRRDLKDSAWCVEHPLKSGSGRRRIFLRVRNKQIGLPIGKTQTAHKNAGSCGPDIDRPLIDFRRFPTFTVLEIKLGIRRCDPDTLFHDITPTTI